MIVPADARSDRIDPATDVAGLPLMRRIAMAGTRAGFERILVHDLSVDGLVAGTAAHRLTPADADPPHTPCRVVILPANLVPRADWLRALRETPVLPDTLYLDTSMTAVIETADPAAILAAASRCGTSDELVSSLRQRFREADWWLERGGRYPLTGSRDVPAAEEWLLRGLIKPTEGFMSRHLERRISLWITRRLVSTRMTPNGMTLVSLAIGLLSAPCFLSAAPHVQLAGALLFLTHSILDGCDGELARLKFLESRRGALLDFWGDNVVHVAVFSSMAVGWSAQAGHLWPLVLGAAAVLSTLGAATVLSGQSVERGGHDIGSSWSARLTDAVANRDFIYLIAVLAAFGRAWWFLTLVATGTPLFVLARLIAGARRKAR